MTKVKIKADCGNSPKMTFVKDFNVAFARGDFDVIIDRVTDDISWELVGSWELEGIDEFRAELDKMEGQNPTEVTIEKVITHGKEGAAKGILIGKNGKKYAFADFYVFSSAKGNKIKSMTTFMTEIEKN